MEDSEVNRLVDWLEGEKCIIPSDKEREFSYQISRNRMIDKTIAKIKEIHK